MIDPDLDPNDFSHLRMQERGRNYPLLADVVDANRRRAISRTVTVLAGRATLLTGEAAAIDIRLVAIDPTVETVGQTAIET